MPMIDVTWRPPAFDGEVELQGYSIWTSVTTDGVEVVTEYRVAADARSWSREIPTGATYWVTARNEVGHSEPSLVGVA